ncbi:hypothetical protein [Dactylosporangium sp. CS-033363]|uniref:hypothetical protein n=1 Tax=Dactylosporangium sp. CS-033363 TaxID=3239935 RepID=UPI003D8B6FD0
MHRLAVAGRVPDLARVVGHRLAAAWMRTSRFADVVTLAGATLTLGPAAEAHFDRARAFHSTGGPGRRWPASSRP